MVGNYFFVLSESIFSNSHQKKWMKFFKKKQLFSSTIASFFNAEKLEKCPKNKGKKGKWKEVIEFI